VNENAAVPDAGPETVGSVKRRLLFPFPGD
jgi:hypothetical protein